MPCYAMACHQRLPCKTRRACERVWHYCEPPYYPAGKYLWLCLDCHAVWRYADGSWWRDARKK